jgi:hypothetical protein
MRVVIPLVACVGAGPSATDTIALVVTRLRTMLKDSEAEGDTERELYAKFKCYCDTNERAKEENIANMAQLISATKAETATLRAENSQLSVEQAAMEEKKSDAETADTQATNMRNSENANFRTEEAYMQASMASLESAIKLLSDVGGDQTAAAADNAGYMANSATAEAKAFLKQTQGSLISMKNDIKRALVAAAPVLPPAQRKVVTSFIEAPGGDYSAASGEIVGILKNMFDTFKANLADLREAEHRSAENYDNFHALKQTEIATLADGIASRKAAIGDKASSVENNMQTLAMAKGDKAEDEDFLRDLRVECEDKKEQFNERNKIRADEAAAISQAIAILNGDEAFDTFAAASQGGVFLQTISRHNSAAAVTRRAISERIGNFARSRSSVRLAKIAMLLASGNPFDKVINEVDKVIVRINNEGQADIDKQDWCTAERATNNAAVADASTQIATLEGQMGVLTSDMEALQEVIDDTNSDINDMKDAIKAQTDSRRAAYLEYSMEMKTLVTTSKIVDKAIASLKKFYDWLAKRDGPHTYGTDAASPTTCTANKDAGGGNYKRMPDATKADLEAACSDDVKCSGFFKFASGNGGWLKSVIAPSAEWYDADGKLCVKVYSSPALLQQAPATFGSSFSGQSSGGAMVISLLEGLKAETNQEAEAEAAQEELDQAEFEQFMTDITADKQRAKEQVADAEEMQALKKQQHVDVGEDRANVAKSKKDTEGYLLDIKYECDFINDNIAARNASRIEEINELEFTKNEILNSPEYAKALAKAEHEAEGKCAKFCFKHCDDAAIADGACLETAKDTLLGEHEVDGWAPCEACRHGVTLVGYCTGEGAGAPGCPPPAPPAA